MNFLKKSFENRWLPYVIFVLCIFVLYTPAIFYGVVHLDDHVLVQAQYPFNKDFLNLPQTFFEDIFKSNQGAGTYYRPLLRISFMLDARFGEKNLIMISHISNIVLHILAVFLLYRMLIAFGLNKGFSFVSSLFFSVHPITTHTVAWIPGRNDSLLAIFVLLSIIFFLKYVKKQKIKYYMLHIATFVLALLTKETAVVLPAICFAYLLLFIDKDTILKKWREYVYILVVYLEILLAWFAVRYAVLGNFAGNEKYDVLSSIFNNSISVIPALGKVFFPVELSVFPTMQGMSLFYGLGTICLLAIIFKVSKENKYRSILFGFCWFLIFIIPTLIKPDRYTPDFSENRLYLPMIGFLFVISGIGIHQFERFFSRKVRLLFVLAIIMVFASITSFRNPLYKDGISFWKNASENSPLYEFNNRNLGIEYYLLGDFTKAEMEFSDALNKYGDQKFVHNYLGLVYQNQGKIKEAEESFKKEIAVSPFYLGGYFNLGMLYNNQKKIEGAEKYWLMLTALNTKQNGDFYRLLAIYYTEDDRLSAEKYILSMKNAEMSVPEDMVFSIRN